MYMGGTMSLRPGLGNASGVSVNFTPVSRLTRKVLTLPSMPLMAICLAFQSTDDTFPRADFTRAKAGEARTPIAMETSATERTILVSDIAAPLPRSSEPRAPPVYHLRAGGRFSVDLRKRVCEK